MSADALDREKLVKLCAMFGSDHTGERANAAAAADRLVRKAGLLWPAVIVRALPPPDADNDDDLIEFVLHPRDRLNEWELAFAVSVSRQRKPPSEKQRAILDELVAKCRISARSAA